jgi:hypothetical protein
MAHPSADPAQLASIQAPSNVLRGHEKRLGWKKSPKNGHEQKFSIILLPTDSESGFRFTLS